MKVKAALHARTRYLAKKFSKSPGVGLRMSDPLAQNRSKLKKEIDMRIREDSPFYGISEEQKEQFMAEAEQLTHMRIAELWEMRSGKPTTEGQVKRFLQRLRYERAVRETDDSSEDWATFAKRAKDGKARDGLIEAARQKLFEEALANGDNTLLLELYKSANEERAREREVLVSQRKARAAEERLRIGWMNVAGGREFLNAAMVSAQPVIDSGGAEDAKLLPRLREALTDSSKKVEDRLAAALEVVQTAGASGHGALLGDGSAETEGADNENRGSDVKKALEAPKPTIDWDAPLRAVMEDFRMLNEREAEKTQAKSKIDNVHSS